MTSTGQLVHSLVASLAVLESRIYQVNRLLVVAYWHDHQILNVSLPKLNIFSDLQLLISRVQQVVNILHVNLHEWQTHWPLVLLLCRLQVIYYIIQWKWYQSLILALYCLQSSHCVCFSSPCLTVNKQWTVVSLEDVIDYGLASVVEDLLLGRYIVKGAVKVKLMDFILEVECDSSFNYFDTLSW